MPNESDRMSLCKIALGDTKNTLTEKDFTSVAQATEGFVILDCTHLLNAP